MKRGSWSVESTIGLVFTIVIAVIVAIVINAIAVVIIPFMTAGIYKNRKFLEVHPEYRGSAARAGSLGIGGRIVPDRAEPGKAE